MNRRCSIFALLTLLWCGTPATAAVAPVGFEAANRLYEQGDFDGAAKAYEALLTPGQRSPAVLFNLGNARFKAGHLGAAIAAYRQASALAPRDPDIRANLGFARDKVAGDTLRRSRASEWLDALSSNEWAMLAAAAWWGFFGLLTLARIRPSLAPALRTWSLLTAGATFVVLVCLLLSWQSHRPGMSAVALAPEATVRNGPLDESKPAFTLRDGAEVELLDSKDDWFRVGASTAKTGWVRKTDVAPVFP